MMEAFASMANERINEEKLKASARASEQIEQAREQLAE